ncbi:Ammonium transporter,Ammonium transporter AmtB-like domain [Cinara cedri]|uniref:Ammonium transporter n=1 Tax=Cinara cedri TaxID=506608 RepID=A0A5E4NEJ8_9HEMI|nr:Ammonium transporter,Ammonium transporter AmtB-like domain [Cinara cedri]
MAGNDSATLQANNTDGGMALMVTQLELDALKFNIDNMFLIVNGIIVSFMQAGFACLEAGYVQPKNVTNILMKNILDLFFCAISYWLIGYGLAYGGGGCGYYGKEYFASVGMPEIKNGVWFFQYVFAATAATIISGAVAERCNFIAYVFYSVIISGFTYPIVSHWVWSSDGWLLKLGYTDFSGAGAVHMLAGTCSFVAALFIGPRIGRFGNFNGSNEYSGHSMPLVATGTMLLISGFLSFNGGSLGHITEPGDGVIVANSVSNTILGGSGAAVLMLILSNFGLAGKSKWPFAMTVNAILIGMVSVCGGVDQYTRLSSLIIGAIGCLVYLVLQWLVPFIKVDDPLECTAVHFGGGLWGVIAVPLFVKGGFWNNRDSMSLLISNSIGAGSIIAWSTVNSVILFGFLRVFDLLRVSKDKEIAGLDMSLHKEQAYPVTALSVENGHKNVKATVIRNAYDNMAMQTAQ